MDNWKNIQHKNIIDFSRSEGVFPSFEKKCVRCKQILPVTFFHHNKRKKDGYSSYCKECIYVVGKSSRLRIKKNAKRKVPSTKLCRRCNRLLPSDEFSKDVHHSDGLSSYCKECNRRRDKEYRNRERVKEKIIVKRETI